MKTIVIIVILTVVALCGYNFITNAVDSAAETSLAEQASKNTATYTIAGEVAKPGTYVIASDATMYDLIEAAGGVTTNADHLAYDVSFVLRPADKSYYIAPLFDNSNTCSVDPIEKCDINSADAETLHEIAGLSNSLSTAVVAYRIENVFGAIEMIKDVPGVGPATYLAIRNKITLRSSGN